MIVCTNCGQENAKGDQFCSSCGSYLEWAGQEVATGEQETEPPVDPAATAGEPSPEIPEDAPTSTSLPSGGPTGDSRGTVAMGSRGPPPVPSPSLPIPVPEPSPPPPGSPEAMKPGMGPPEARRPAARRPEARKPAAAKPKPPPKAPPPPTHKPGGLICGQCGEHNDPGRRFCRRCGGSLADAADAPDDSAAAEPSHVAAGDRPGRRGASIRSRGAAATVRRVIAIAGGAAVIGLLVGVIGPWRSEVSDWGNDIYRSIRRRIAPQYEQVRPVQAEASSALPGHEAQTAIDGASNLAWSEAGPGPGVGSELTMTFDRAVDVDRVGFLSGASAEPKEFVAQPRPREMRLLFSDGSEASVTLKDSPQFQSFDVEARDVDSVRLRVVSEYASLGEDLSIREVEFFTKK